MRKPKIFVSFAFVAAIAVVSAQEEFRPLRGPYMGQEAGVKPRILLPGKIATGAEEGCSFFLPGALSFLWRVRRGDDDLLLLLEDRDGRWQPPRPVQLPENAPEVWDFTLSPNGEFVYFTSDRSVAGAAGNNLWRAQIQDGGFVQAEPLSGEVNTDSGESYPSVTRDGALYFFTWDPRDHENSDLLRANSAGNGIRFEKPERLPEPVNSRFLDYDPFIAADGSYLIFASKRPGGEGQGDLYITFAGSDGWIPPVNLGPEINSSAEENRPSATLDGRYFFFTSNRKTDVALPAGIPPRRQHAGQRQP